MKNFKLSAIQSSSLFTGLIAASIALIPNSVLLAEGIPQTWESNEYQPPAFIGTPEGTVGGATRGGSRKETTSLISLTPNNRFGVTTAAYPTFLVYLPALDQDSFHYAEFTLLDESGEEIYKVEFQTKISDSIMQVAMPTQLGLAPLEVGKNYRWSFNIYEDSYRWNRNSKTQGWISRVELEEQLAQRLENSSPAVQASLYAENEIWYDAVATLAELYKENPNDPLVASDWKQLLIAVGLNQIVSASVY